MNGDTALVDPVIACRWMDGRKESLAGVVYRVSLLELCAPLTSTPSIHVEKERKRFNKSIT